MNKLHVRQYRKLFLNGLSCYLRGIINLGCTLASDVLVHLVLCLVVHLCKDRHAS